MKLFKNSWCVNELNLRAGIVTLTLALCSVWPSALMAGWNQKEVEDLRARRDAMYVDGVRIKGEYILYINAVFEKLNKATNKPIWYYKFFVIENDDNKTVDVKVMVDTDVVDREGLPIPMDEKVSTYTLDKKSAKVLN